MHEDLQAQLVAFSQESIVLRQSTDMERQQVGHGTEVSSISK